MKCELCKNDIQTQYLEKMIGTVVKDAKGKKHFICASCQKENQSKQKLLDQLTK